MEALVSWRCLRKCIPIESWNDKWTCEVVRIRTLSETFPWSLSRLQARRLGLSSRGCFVIIWVACSHHYHLTSKYFKAIPSKARVGKARAMARCWDEQQNEKQQHPWEKTSCLRWWWGSAMHVPQMPQLPQQDVGRSVDTCLGIQRETLQIWRLHVWYRCRKPPNWWLNDGHHQDCQCCVALRLALPASLREFPASFMEIVLPRRRILAWFPVLRQGALAAITSHEDSQLVAACRFWDSSLRLTQDVYVHGSVATPQAWHQFVLLVLMDCGWHVVAWFLYNFDESWQGFAREDIVVFSYGMGQRGPQAQSPASWSKNAAKPCKCTKQSVARRMQFLNWSAFTSKHDKNMTCEHVPEPWDLSASLRIFAARKGASVAPVPGCSTQMQFSVEQNIQLGSFVKTQFEDPQLQTSRHH